MWRHIKQILQVIILATAMLVSCSHRTVLGKATKCSITFYLVHTTLSNYNWVTRISAHTHWVEISNPLYKVNQRFKCFFFHTMLCKRKPRDLEKSCTCKCVLRRTNALYEFKSIPSLMVFSSIMRIIEFFFFYMQAITSQNTIIWPYCWPK